MFVKIFGIIYTIMGVAFLVKPAMIKRLKAFWQNDKMLYIGGLLTLLLGIGFLLSASQCRLIGLVIAFGIICILKAILIFSLGLKGLSPILSWWERIPPVALRLIACVAIGIGALLIYAA